MHDLIVKLVEALLALVLAWAGISCTAAVPSAAIQNYPPSTAVNVNAQQVDDGSTAAVNPQVPATQPSR